MTLFSKLAPLLRRPRSSTSKATDSAPQTRVGSVAAPLSEAQKEVRADIKRAADNGDWDWAA